MTGPTLVTGGAGMLGTALRRHIPDAVYLARTDGDLRELSTARALIAKHNPTTVIHLAARVGGVKENAAKNVEFWEENALVNTNVLLAAREAGVRRLVAPLSTCAFPFYDDRPTTERDLHEGIPYDGNLGYGYAKRALEVHARLIARQEGLAYSTFTPATMFGPHDNFRLEDGHVVGALVHKCVAAMENGDRLDGGSAAGAKDGAGAAALDVWGDGTAIRQFVFVEDVARAVADLARRDTTEHVIVAADEGITVRTLAKSVARACGFTGAIRFDATKPSGMKRKVMRSDNFAKLFPGFAFTPLATGLAATVEWFKAHRGET